MGKRTENTVSDSNTSTIVQSGQIGVLIQNASGPIHTGSGDQIITTGSGQTSSDNGRAKPNTR